MRDAHLCAAASDWLQAYACVAPLIQRSIIEKCITSALKFTCISRYQRSRALTNITLHSSTIWAEPSHDDVITVFGQTYLPKHRLLRISVQIQSVENVLSSQWAISTKAKMPCYFLTLARAAARRAAKVASALLALSMAGRGFGIPVILLALTPAQNSTISQSINHAFIWHISPQGPGMPNIYMH